MILIYQYKLAHKYQHQTEFHNEIPKQQAQNQ